MNKERLFDRSLFKTAYMAFLLVNIIPMVNHWRYTDLILLVFVVWGLFLLAVDVYRHGLSSFRYRVAVPLCIFYLLCGISLLVNYENALLNSLLRLGVFFLCGAVLYITRDDRDMLEREALSVGVCYALVTGAMALVSVGMYVVQFQYTFTGPLEETIRIGVWENRLFGLFTSSNVGGSLMAIGLLADAGLLGWLHRQGRLTVRWWLLLGGAAVFHSWYIALSLSRGTAVSLLAAAVALFAGWAFSPAPRFITGWLRRVGCLLAAVTVFYCVQAGARQFSLSAVRFLADRGLVESDVTGFDRLEFEGEDGQMADISNKRFSIWKSSVRLARGKWLFGTGRNYYEYLNHREASSWLTEDDHVYLTWSRGNTHNGYLQILVDAGLPALLAYMTFLVWCLVRHIRAYRLSTVPQRRGLAVCLAIVVYVLINNLFETNMVLMSTNPIQAIFWFTAGVDMALCRRIIRQRKEEPT